MSAQGCAPKVLFVTLGCAKNEVDTDRMRALLQDAGYGEAVDAEEADLALINTCSFLASATSESLEATLELAEASRQGARSLPIVMCGCVPSRYGKDLPDELPEVSAFVRTDEEDGIVAVVDRVLGRQTADVPASRRDVLRSAVGASAYVKISDGCDRFCSFCAIPYIRGRYASRPQEEILAEVAELMGRGVREVVLIGQDTGIWGSDLDEPSSLAALLRAVDAVVAPYGGWVRVLYLQPEGMTDELVSALRDLPSVLPYIDIPVQHCDGDVLAAMNRSGDRASLERLFERLRGQIPGIVLRSTGLVGFPGESEEAFEDLCDFVDEQGFDYLSVFPFSAEEGTRAASMDGQVPDEVRLERAQRLQDLAESLGFAATAAHVGERVQVLIDGVDTDGDVPELVGHAWFQAPDCDGAVHIPEGDFAVGDMVTVDLVDSFCYELVGRPVTEEAQQ